MIINIPSPTSIKSWQPKLIGLLTALFTVLQGIHSPTWKAMFSDPAILIGAALTLLAMVTKQATVTGGTSGQPSTHEAIIESNHAPAVGPAAPAPDPPPAH